MNNEAVTRHNSKELSVKSQKHKPLSQSERAEQLGVTREHLNRVLRGKRESRRLIRAHKLKFGGAK